MVGVGGAAAPAPVAELPCVSRGSGLSAGTFVHAGAGPGIAGEAVVIPSRTTKDLQTDNLGPPGDHFTT
jgi:hypothetical protein